MELVTSLPTVSKNVLFQDVVDHRSCLSIMDGTNFQGACNALNQLDWDKIVEYSTIKRIEWKFNPPASPWWGGWWERL